MEGWHRGLQRNVSSCHPTFWKCLDVQKSEQSEVRVSILQNLGGHPALPQMLTVDLFYNICGMRWLPSPSSFYKNYFYRAHRAFFKKSKAFLLIRIIKTSTLNQVYGIIIVRSKLFLFFNCILNTVNDRSLGGGEVLSLGGCNCPRGGGGGGGGIIQGAIVPGEIVLGQLSRGQLSYNPNIIQKNGCVIWSVSII